MARTDRNSGSTATPTTHEISNHRLYRRMLLLRGFNTVPNSHVCGFRLILYQERNHLNHGKTHATQIMNKIMKSQKQNND
jgi:hypothetical protein